MKAYRPCSMRVASRALSSGWVELVSVGTTSPSWWPLWGPGQDCCQHVHPLLSSPQLWSYSENPCFPGGWCGTAIGCRITSIPVCMGGEPHCPAPSPRLCQTSRCRCRAAAVPPHAQLPERTASITNRPDAEAQPWQASPPPDGTSGRTQTVFSLVQVALPQP